MDDEYWEGMSRSVEAGGYEATGPVEFPPPTTVAELCQLLGQLPGEALVLVDGTRLPTPRSGRS